MGSFPPRNDSFTAFDALLTRGVIGSPSAVISSEVFATVSGFGLASFGLIWGVDEIYNPILTPAFGGYKSGFTSSFGMTFSLWGPTLVNSFTSSFGLTNSLYGPTLITGWSAVIV